MVRCWFRMIEDLTEQKSTYKFPEIATYAAYLTSKVKILVQYILTYAIREPRRDRVKSKIKRSAPSLDLFDDLHTILFVNDSKYAIQVSGNNTAGRYTRPAKRGMALFISDSLLNKDKATTINRMNEINLIEKMR